jgi:hypothetical protein
MDTNETKTHWKKLVDPRYIGAYALPNGDDITVTIERVQLETVTMMGGKKEDHTICHLKGQKPMILNVTNSKSIHKLYGPFIEDWAGKQITLFASTAKLGNELVECLRIRPSVAAKKPAQLTDARFKAAMEGIKAGTYTAAKLRAGAALTDAQQAALKELESEVA